MRRRIIEAGIKVICKKGYAGTTTTLIRKEAKVSQGILFHHFETKQALLFAIVQHGIEQFMETIRKHVGDEKDPFKQLEKVAFAYCEKAESMSGLLEIIFGYVKVLELTREQMRSTGLLQLREMMRRIIEPGIKQGVIRKIDPYVVVTSLFGTLSYNFHRWLMEKKTFSLQDSVRVSVEIITRGIKAV